MNPDSQLRIVTALSAVADGHIGGSLCATCAELVRVGGAAIVVVADSGNRAVLCASNDTAAVLENLQVTLGEGPGIDAHEQRVPVGEPDLARTGRSRWLVFCGPALEAGAAAVFAFPLRLGGIRLGTLTLSHDRPGRLADDQYADALAVSDIVTQAVLTLQADAPPGMVAQALGAVADDGIEIHQAAGMVAVRLGVSVGEALVRLRAIAYSEERPLDDVAHDVVAHRLPLP